MEFRLDSTKSGGVKTSFSEKKNTGSTFISYLRHFSKKESLESLKVSKAYFFIFKVRNLIPQHKSYKNNS